MASILIRGMATSAAESAIKHVTVIGGGLMGSGIAQVSDCTLTFIGSNFVPTHGRHKVHSPMFDCVFTSTRNYTIQRLSHSVFRWQPQLAMM